MNDIHWGPTLIRLGVPENFLNGKHGPCPFCGGRDRWRFTDYKSEGYFICNHCTPDGGNGFEFVKRFFSCTFEEALDKVKESPIIVHHNAGMAEKQKFARARTKMIGQYRNLESGRISPASAYLASRGIDFPDPFWQDTPRNETWAYQREAFGCFWLPDFQEGYGAMAWKAIDPFEKKISQLHMTTLDVNGSKAPVEQVKKYSQAIYPLDKQGYRVAPLVKGDPDVCLIAEGIETALSCWMIFKLLAPNDQPPTVYASMDAGMLARFVPYMPVSDKQRWVVCGDNDVSMTGQKAAAACMINIGRHLSNPNMVYTALPSVAGQDWNDILLSGDEEQMMRIVRPV